MAARGRRTKPDGSADPAADAGTPPRPGLRLGERLAGGFFRTTTRVTGLRPSLIPTHMRRQLELIGVDAAQLARVLASMRSLADWPYAWEAEGDRNAADGRWLTASASYYVGQRLLLTPSPLKDRLYALTLDAYDRAGLPIERLRVAGEVNDIAGLLEMPDRVQPASGFPLVVMVGGVTSTKEEMHVYSEPMRRRGFAVARIDNPGYGETTGVMELPSLRNAARVLGHLAADQRIDGTRMHLFGNSLGGACVLHSSYEAPAISTTVIAAPLSPWRYLHQLPPSNLTAMRHMTATDDHESLYRVVRSFDAAPAATRISHPVRIFHGGRDRTIPVSDAHAMAELITAKVQLTVYERDHHNCLEHFHEIVALALEWMDGVS